MTVVCLEPEAVGNGPMNGDALAAHRAMRGGVMGTEGGDVEAEGGSPMRSKTRAVDLSTASCWRSCWSSVLVRTLIEVKPRHN